MYIYLHTKVIGIRCTNKIQKYMAPNEALGAHPGTVEGWKLRIRMKI
jgi:hypothetical protein